MATHAHHAGIGAKRRIARRARNSQQHATNPLRSRQADIQHPADTKTGSRLISAVKPLSSHSSVTSRANAAPTSLSRASRPAPAARPSLEHLKLAQMLLSCVPSQLIPLLGRGISADQLGERIIAYVRRHYDRASVDAVTSKVRPLAIEADAEWKAEFHRSQPLRIYNPISQREELLASSRELIALAAFRRQMALAGEAVRHEDADGAMAEELEDLAREAKVGLWPPRRSAGECM
ncbi:hypothetical protein Tdes44962_MAKER08711 [Teratosphaeria destructans]|uniref:Uncharacterized protein n=1 Tax=Teratosphaeria destructans TaxID=418781 RepID=A0A9W7W486_9PEZI|nr:hypothetical protein Tdes44962_MAKER08711 [Teratosphaeria destructans]